MGLRPDPELEHEGLDVAMHGEEAYATVGGSMHLAPEEDEPAAAPAAAPAAMATVPTPGDGWSGSGAEGDPYALDFDGANGFAATGVFADASGGWTLDTWVKWSGVHDPTYDVVILCHGVSSSDGYYLRHFRSGSVYMYLHRAGSAQQVLMTGGLAAGEWTHIVFVYDPEANTAQFIRNGVAQTPVALAAAQVPSISRSLYLGVYNGQTN